MYTVEWTPGDPIQNLLAELRTLERTQPHEYEMHVFAMLPTAPIPADVDMEYPIWAMDIHRYCLAGITAAAIEHLDAIQARSAQEPVHPKPGALSQR
jgi:hypothetical protein